MNKRLDEVMARIGSRPALINMASVGDFFADSTPYRVEDGIAIIDICGPLSNAEWSWRGTTYGDIQSQLRQAVEDSDVRGILLNVNSPGGECDNAFETADLIAKAGEKKPVYACAATMAYSAAYLLASQAEKIYCTPKSGGVGSIGVYCAHFDYSEMLKKEGVKVTLVSAGEGKTAGTPYQPLSSDDLEEIQGDIDRLYAEFVASVSGGRGIASTEVVKLGARCYDSAPKAIGARLADASGDLSTAWVEMCAAVQQSSASNGFMKRGKGSVASATNSQKENTSMDKETADAAKTAEAEAQLKASIDAAKTAGYADALEVMDLCSIAGVDMKTAKGFLDARKPAAEVRKELMQAKADAQKGSDLNTGVMPGTDAGAASAQQGKGKPWTEVLASLGFAKRGK